MSPRRTVSELFSLDEQSFRTRAAAFLDNHGLDADRTTRPVGDAVAALDELAAADSGSTVLDDHERALVWRVWVLDRAPVGITLSGPAYQDNPIRYANRTFREMVGYSLSELVGENPRLLQGPETESAPVDDLREALAIWEPVTVELRNYRRDGSSFRNRVSLVPVEDGTGTVTNWVGIQTPVAP
jgi:PAS domain S-box-containing protein